MEGCVKPFTENKSIINEICNKFGTPKKASDEEVLHKGKTYIFKIKESINFHDTYFSGKATGKSTIGRLDVLTRVIPKAHHEYDTIKSKSSSDLFLEITPLTFPIIVKEGTGMSQLRVFAGHPGISELPEQWYFYLEDHIFDEHGNAIHNNERRRGYARSY
jgi:deoxycytidine triphosphate deaminase